MAIANQLKWKKYHPLSDQNAFICLVDVMGDDNAIVQAARASYDGFAQGLKISSKAIAKVNKEGFNFNLASDVVAIDNRPDMDGYPEVFIVYFEDPSVRPVEIFFSSPIYQALVRLKQVQIEEDRHLTRYLMNHSHTTPFEMVTVKFMVQVPMDCWRQWVRHRTASINEYSTRYMEALDFFQVTEPTEWRLQSTDNKQGSSGFLTEWPENEEDSPKTREWTAGEWLSDQERLFQKVAIDLYQERIALGVAKEQARKDLPLSTYTRAYWQCNLRNIFHFLRLRMDRHAQLEIRSYANCIYEIVKQVCPVACEAFEDYVLHAKRFSRMEMKVMKILLARAVENQEVMQEFSYDDTISREEADSEWNGRLRQAISETTTKPNSMTDREWKEFIAKVS